MKWLIVIELTCTRDKIKILERELRDLIEETNEKQNQPIIKIYNRVGVDSDLSIHLFNDTGEINENPLALHLVSALKDFGLVNYSTWTEKYNT